MPLNSANPPSDHEITPSRAPINALSLTSPKPTCAGATTCTIRSGSEVVSAPIAIDRDGSVTHADLSEHGDHDGRDETR